MGARTVDELVSGWDGEVTIVRRARSVEGFMVIAVHSTVLGRRRVDAG